MEKLTIQDKELVAIGAALGSNCIPCIEYHISTAMKAQLTTAQIMEAIEIANTVRTAPAESVLKRARELCSKNETTQPDNTPQCGCQQESNKIHKSKCC